MHYETFTAGDGCELAFQTSLLLDWPDLDSDQERYATCILLLHGFSGSSWYFTRNYDALSQKHWVVAPDMRGHGRSGHNSARGGYHVARLATDLRELLTHLRRRTDRASTRFIPVGCSIGAAILWTYIELFGESEFAGFVFVDQAPLQDRSIFGAWDETRAHRGCYDEKSLLAAQEGWVSRPEKTHRALVAECLGYRYHPLRTDGVSDEQARQDEEFFTAVSAKCNGEWLAKLLADHTRYDHREAIEGITLPTLVMAGRRSGCFPLAGMAEIVERIRKGRGGTLDGKVEMSVFDSGHWLFYEEPERFNREVLAFVKRCA
jgi:pimeloyl-ACP methyl ester carboxylesterase